MRYSIYTLADPRTQEIRYVGITAQSLRTRLGNHVRHARTGENTYRARWVRMLLAQDLKPDIALVEQTDDPLRECYWIEHYRSQGCKLTNTTSGGRAGTTMSDEVKQRIGASSRGRKLSPEARARLSRALKGRPTSEATRAKLRAANLGKKNGPLSEETRRKMAATKRGHAVSDVTREKLRRANLGKARGHKARCKRGHPYSPETARINVRGAYECRICEKLNRLRRLGRLEPEHYP